MLINATAPGSTTPSFATRQTFAVGSYPTSVAIGDLNGDGKPDLAVANFNGFQAPTCRCFSTRRPCRGATTPSFATQATFAVGTHPRSVAIGDLNGDGKPDLAVANLGSSTVSVLLNTTAPGATTPSFAAQATFAAGANPSSVAIGDLNGDGKPDLAVANFDSENVSVLLNTTATGATTPSFATQVTFTVGSLPESVVIGDLNGDGKPDLAAANSNSNSVSVLLNTALTGTSSATFTANSAFTVGVDPFSVAIGDLNGDGKPDLAATNRYSNTVSVLLNTTAPGATTPTFAAQAPFAVGSGPSWVAIGDLNGDGKPDLAVANDGPGTVSVLLNTTTPGSTTTSFSAATDLAVGSKPDSVAIGDLNGDGKPDLAVANLTDNSVSVLLNTTAPGATTPSFAAQATFAVGPESESVAIGDLNGDGKPDLIVVNSYSNTVSVLLNTTGAGEVDHTPIAVLATQATFATSGRTSHLRGDRRPERRRQARPGRRQLRLGHRVGAAQHDGAGVGHALVRHPRRLRRRVRIPFPLRSAI